MKKNFHLVANRFGFLRRKTADAQKRHELKEYLMRVQHVPSKFADQIVDEAWRIFRS